MSKSVEYDTFSLQYFDNVGWATGRASEQASVWKKLGWYVGGDDLIGALHVL